MSSTNKTTNYQLSQFQNNDIPAWLTDYNGDMQKIDAGIHAAKVQADGAASGVSSLQTAMSGKQDKLTFDTTPINGSNNPVTSGGIYNALQSASVETDAVPTAGSTKPVQSGGVYTALQGKQNTLTFDSTPTEGSTNPVTSGGVYAAIQNYGSNQFNASGDFKKVSNGNNYPKFRYLHYPNHLFIATTSRDGISITGSRWTPPTDNTFPSTNKLLYIEGNPFSLTPNSTFPKTQVGILSMNSVSVGSAEYEQSDSSKTGVFFHLCYVSDENRTYLFAQANNPKSTNDTIYGVQFIGDVSYS